jgi:hypothetical protein
MGGRLVSQSDIFPKPFIPSAPSEKNGWVFSGAHRAHQALVQAHQAPDEPGSLQAVEHVCRRLDKVGADGAVAREEMLAGRVGSARCESNGACARGAVVAALGVNDPSADGQ